MFFKSVPVELVSEQRYEQLLARGWFRGHSVLYTTPIVRDEDNFYGVKHPRFALAEFQMKPKHLRLFRKNAAFTVEISPLKELDEERETLYQMHLSRFKGYTYASLHDAVMAPAEQKAFALHEVCIRHQGRIIALSYFDITGSSAATIMGIFSMEYKKHSLGLYTMLLEIEHCRQLGLHYYYTGYILEDNPWLNYKITLGKPQWLQPDHTWALHYPEADTKARVLRKALAYIKLKLTIDGYKARKRVYLFYRQGDVHNEYVPYPVYYQWRHGGQRLAIAYNVDTGKYILFSLWPDSTHEANEQHPPELENKVIYEHRRMMMGYSIALDNLDELPVQSILMPTMLYEQLMQVRENKQNF